MKTKKEIEKVRLRQEAWLEGYAKGRKDILNHKCKDNGCKVCDERRK